MKMLGNHLNPLEDGGTIPRVFTYEMRQDDPAKCTSAKMRRMGLAKNISRDRISNRSLVLNPASQTLLQNSDRTTALSGGIVVIDCSWARAQEVFDVRFKGVQRKLPALLAGNPTNYAIIGSLSSLEAVAACLYITGFMDRALKFLTIYKWGQTFLTLNKEVLDDYSKAGSSEEVREIELSYFPKLV